MFNVAGYLIEENCLQNVRNFYPGGRNSTAIIALHFVPRMNAVFAFDVATALRQINR